MIRLISARQYLVFQTTFRWKKYTRSGIKTMCENKKKGLNAVCTQSFLL